MPPDDGGGRSVPPASPRNEGKVLVVRLGEMVLIHDLKRQGLSVTAIARQPGLDRKTGRRHLDRGLEPPGYGPPASRRTRSFRASACCAKSARWVTPAAIAGLPTSFARCGRRGARSSSGGSRRRLASRAKSTSPSSR